jgi:cell shape-determining protein MreC
MSSTHQSLPRTLLPVSIGVMCVLSFTPVRFSKAVFFVEWAGQLTRIMVAPIRQPGLSLARYLKRDGEGEADPEEIRILEGDRDRLLARVLQLEEDNRRLNEQLQVFATGDWVSPSTPPMRLYAPIIGRSANPVSDVLTARAGSRKGVREGYVAVTGAVQLLGRVREVSPLDCQVMPITDRRAPAIGGIVETVTGERQPCQLEWSDGVLRGPVGVEEIGAIEIGQVVRLDDRNWPVYVQQYVIGEVRKLEFDEDNPLAVIMTVAPPTDLAIVSDAFILIPPGGGDVGGGG